MLGSELGAEVNVKNMYGSTPLHYDAWGGHVEVVRMYLGPTSGL